MEQYIPKASVVAEIERRKHKLLDNIMFERDKEWVVRTAHQLNRIILFLDTLEVKEPANEELEEYAQRESELFGEREYEVDSLDRNALRKGFYWGCKAGAEWMASQGETAEVGYWNQRGLSLCLDKSLEKLGYKDGDKVIIQIRKKRL